MKRIINLSFAAILAGCDSNPTVNSEPDKEPEMFFGQRPKQNYVISSPMAGVLMNMENRLPCQNPKTPQMGRGMMGR
jgi:hypothetical protein